MAFVFYTGSPEASWLGRAGFPLFVSRQRLGRVRRAGTLPRARCGWALDSGGFTEIARHGRWTIGDRQLAREAEAWAGAIGQLDWSAPRDWMCEPDMLRKTGKTVAEHQALTTRSLLELRALAARVHFIPVLQGYAPDDYRRHADSYQALGVDLAAEPVVGLGSVCRRQGTGAVEPLIRELAAAGIRLHGFGFKLQGLAAVWRHLASADSMAWSHSARKKKLRLPFCTHARCQNCLACADRFRTKVLREAVGAWDLCPECGSDDVHGPHNDTYVRSCVECGYDFPVHLAHGYTGYDIEEAAREPNDPAGASG